MADVRCPMCSKPNPADVQLCQHCGARLKPLVAPSQPASPSSSTPPPAGGQDASDWLGDFRSDDGEGAFNADAGETFDSGDGADWFSRLGQEDASTPAAPPAKPDWLAAPSEKGDPNVPDWMEELNVSANAEQGQDAWGQFSQAEEPAQGSADADELKDWLAGLSDDETTSPAGGASAGDLPDWLSGFDTGTQPEGEIPQQFASQPPADEPANIEEPLPDWLSAVPGDEPAAPLDFTEEAEAGAEPAELPDWLTAPGGLPEPVVPTETPLSSQPSGLPDWLSGIEAPDLGEAPQEPGQAQEAETLPSWLSESAGEETSAQEFGAFPASEPEALDAGLQSTPNWLSQFEEVSGDELPAASAESQGTVVPKPFPTGSLSSDDFLADNTPDWLSNLGGLEEITSDEAAAAQPLGGGTDWLSGLGDLGDESTPEAAPESAETPAGTFGMSDASWGEDTQEKEAGGAFEMADLDANPDWLSNVTAPEAGPEEAPTPEPANEETDVTPAELPTWLEAMRPVESAAPSAAFRDETDTRVESAGPLSGLRGVLQAEPDVSNFRKPPVYTNKLQMTETHQARIALLEELVSSEGKPKPVQAFVPVRSQAVLRWVIALVLSAAAIFGLLGASQIVPLPASELPQEIKNLRGSIEALPPNAPVLVVVDYDAGSSAEVDYPARMVLQNLEQRQAFIGLVSSSLNGPMLSELLLSQVDASTGITYTNYTLLGYIPGGASGLLSFARAPYQVMVRLDGKGLENVPSSLSDFDLVIVMTDDANTARMWIEQAHPMLDADTPLMMVLSAQAEPMVRPYFLTGLADGGQAQLSGYIAGMSGAAAYHSKLNPDEVLKEWDALAMASIFAIVMIILGGLVNFGLAVSSRPKGKK